MAGRHRPATACDRPNDMANGNVYVFNVFSEDMTLFSTNGVQAGTIPAWSDGSGALPMFTPASLAVGRVLNAIESPAHFYNGTNKVILTWPSGIWTFSLPIDGARFPITQNLVVMIEADRWQFIDSNGVVVSAGNLQPGPANVTLAALLRSALPRGVNP